MNETVPKRSAAESAAGEACAALEAGGAENAGVASARTKMSGEMSVFMGRIVRQKAGDGIRFELAGFG